MLQIVEADMCLAACLDSLQQRFAMEAAQQLLGLRRAQTTRVLPQAGYRPRRNTRILREYRELQVTRPLVVLERVDAQSKRLEYAFVVVVEKFDLAQFEL